MNNKRALILLSIFITLPLVCKAQENKIRIDSISSVGQFDLPKPSVTSSYYLDYINYVHPTVQELNIINEKAVSISDTYNPAFPISRQSLTYGEYDVSGVILRTRKGIVVGSGKQENMISLGIVNNASISYIHSFNPRLTATVSATTTKFSAPYMFNQSIGGSGLLRYRLSDRVILNAFGSYNFNINSRISYYNFGGSAEIDIIGRFGLEAGIQTYYDNFSNHWETLPIVSPYYRINEDCKIGFDFGPILKDVLHKSFIKVGGKGNPTIAPPKL